MKTNDFRSPAKKRYDAASRVLKIFLLLFFALIFCFGFGAVGFGKSVISPFFFGSLIALFAFVLLVVVIISNKIMNEAKKSMTPQELASLQPKQAESNSMAYSQEEPRKLKESVNTDKKKSGVLFTIILLAFFCLFASVWFLNAIAKILSDEDGNFIISLLPFCYFFLFVLFIILILVNAVRKNGKSMKRNSASDPSYSRFQEPKFEEHKGFISHPGLTPHDKQDEDDNMKQPTYADFEGNDRFDYSNMDFGTKKNDKGEVPSSRNTLCSKCGHINEPGSNYCAACGEKL